MIVALSRRCGSHGFYLKSFNSWICTKLQGNNNANKKYWNMAKFKSRPDIKCKSKSGGGSQLAKMVNLWNCSNKVLCHIK